MQTERDPDPTPSAEALRRLPAALLALAGACAVSALGGLVAALVGRPAPPLELLVAPPALALVGVGWWLSRPPRGRS